MHLQVHQLAKRKRMLCCLSVKNESMQYVCMPIHEVQNCLQILLPFEAHSIDVNDNIKIHLSCPSHNKINLHISQNETEYSKGKHLLSATLEPCAFYVSDVAHDTNDTNLDIDNSLLRCLQAVNAEFLPLFTVCRDLTHAMQNYCGDSLLPMFKKQTNSDTPAVSIADYFVQDNSSILSKFNDQMNSTAAKKFSHKYCAKLLHLASLFCASAPRSRDTNQEVMPVHW